MKYTQKGQSLIEISVVLLLVSISLTGMVTMMLTSQRLSRSAVQQLDAAMLARNLVNKMYLNQQELKALDSKYITDMDASTKIALLCSGSSNCPQQLQAQFDLIQWQQEVAKKLPEYRVSICRDYSPYDGEYLNDNDCDNNIKSPVAIKIWWKDRAQLTNEVQFHALSFIP
ncbi:MAG: type IV pilus modification protein PilV [Oceanospirillaceae bacterium]